MFNARTDLVVEAREMHLKNKVAEIQGTETETEEFDYGISVTRVTISDEQGAKVLGKPKGKYITLELPEKGQVRQEAYEEACRVCALELCRLLSGKGCETVLVAGLGNRGITADSVGPKCVDSVLVTRHLLEYMPEEIDNRLRAVCAVAPGVLGITGIETGEIVKGLVDRIKPSVVIAVDALCSRSMERVNSTIQMSDTGIAPGAGIGNKRMALDEANLGIPVIAIGVPTVIDAATIAGDAIDMLVEDMKKHSDENSPLFRMLSTIADEDKYSVIKEVLEPAHGAFVVTPKEIDMLVGTVSDIIANGINIAIHEGITLEDIDRYK